MVHMNLKRKQGEGADDDDDDVSLTQLDKYQVNIKQLR